MDRKRKLDEKERQFKYPKLLQYMYVPKIQNNENDIIEENDTNRHISVLNDSQQRANQDTNSEKDTYVVEEVIDVTDYDSTHSTASKIEVSDVINLSDEYESGMILRYIYLKISFFRSKS